ncbi:MAG: histidine phosphatase family protein [Treponema sp.]|nr:histidine phosphatase family protein [Treponema sp.]
MKNNKKFSIFGAAAILLVFVALAACASKDKPVTIYVTRHGKTLFNTKELIQGWADSPLTPEGIAVVRDLGRGLRDVPFDYVISSDLIRARETARLVMEQNRASKNYLVEDSEMLREACFGDFEGAPYDAIMKASAKAAGASPGEPAQDPLIWLKTADAIKRMDTSGMAEDTATIKARMQTKLTEVAQALAKKGGNVLLVAHGQSINIMLSDLDPSFNFTGTPLENASVCKLIYNNGKFTIQSVNDTSYIEAGRRLH